METKIIIINKNCALCSLRSGCTVLFKIFLSFVKTQLISSHCWQTTGLQYSTPNCACLMCHNRYASVWNCFVRLGVCFCGIAVPTPITQSSVLASILKTEQKHTENDTISYVPVTNFVICIFFFFQNIVSIMSMYLLKTKSIIYFMFYWHFCIFNLWDLLLIKMTVHRTTSYP